MVGPNTTSDPMTWTVYNDYISSQETCNKVAQKEAEDSAAIMLKQMNAISGGYSTAVVKSTDSYHFMMQYSGKLGQVTPMFVMWHVCLPEGEKPNIVKIRSEQS